MASLLLRQLVLLLPLIASCLALPATSTVAPPTPRVMIVTPAPSKAVAEKAAKEEHGSRRSFEYPTGPSGGGSELLPAGHTGDGYPAYPDADEEEAIPYHHQPSSKLINPAYDPDLHHNYVHNYAPTYGQHPDHSAYGAWVPAWGPAPNSPITVVEHMPYPAAPYPGMPPASPILLPPPPPPPVGALAVPPPPPPFLPPLLGALMPQFGARSLAFLLVRSLGWVISTVGAIAFGGALTSAVCALTPICPFVFFSFLGLRQNVQKLLGGLAGSGGSGDGLATETTKEAAVKETTLARTAEQVRTAVEKFEQMQVTEEAEKSEAEA